MVLKEGTAFPSTFLVEKLNVNVKVQMHGSMICCKLFFYRDTTDIFNTDYTGLFFKCTPNKIFNFYGESYNGGKHRMEHITFLVGTMLIYQKNCL